MNKLNKKLTIIIFGYILFILVFSYTQSVNAANLEVKYPVAHSGFAPTNTDTPLPEFLKYLFDVGMFVGFASAFYSIALAGVFYLMSGLKPEFLSSARDRISGSISGIILLVLIYLIVTTLNPQLAIFKSGDLKKVDVPPSNKTPGVYFYKSENCTGDFRIDTVNVIDFGEKFKNQIKSAEIVNGPNQEYVSTVYDSPGLFGTCLDIDPTITGCQKIESIGNSASVHLWNFDPDGDGVYIYRKPFYNPDGGWIKISNAQIGGNVFGEELQNLTFNGDNGACTVPIDEQTCSKWDNKGNCTQKDCPTLAGREISSIKILGDYIVFLVYLDPSDVNTTWSYCQEFPTPNDANRSGPQQIKWEKVTNQKNIPNLIYIYPVKNK